MEENINITPTGNPPETFRRCGDHDASDLALTGLICPRCEKAVMEINFLMNLYCPNCEYVLGGGYT
jgi:hypothetical protein